MNDKLFEKTNHLLCSTKLYKISLTCGNKITPWVQVKFNFTFNWTMHMICSVFKHFNSVFGLQLTSFFLPLYVSITRRQYTRRTIEAYLTLLELIQADLKNYWSMWESYLKQVWVMVLTWGNGEHAHSGQYTSFLLLTGLNTAHNSWGIMNDILIWKKSQETSQKYQSMCSPVFIFNIK